MQASTPGHSQQLLHYVTPALWDTKQDCWTLCKFELNCLWCVQDIMLSRDKRCKVAVHVTGANKAKPQQQADAAVTTSSGETAAAQTADADRDSNDKQPELAATEDNGDADMQPVIFVDVQLIEDVWAFKRAQMLYPAVK